MRQPSIQCLPLLSLLLLITLTSGKYRDDQPIEQYLALANQAEYDCVGQVLVSDSGQWEPDGSFVLIDSLHILSAAHCFTMPIKKDTVINYQGQKLLTYVELGRRQRDKQDFAFLVHNTILKARKIVLHPDYLQDGNCDLAIITLEAPLSHTPTLPLNKEQHELRDTVTGVGFGLSGPGNKPDLVGMYNVKLAGQNIIDSIGGIVVNGTGSMLFSDFDAPDGDTKYNKCGSRLPLPLEYCISSGDSGGPAFISRKGTLYLAGIAVYEGKTLDMMKNGYYGELMGWLRISAFYNWIAEQLK